MFAGITYHREYSVARYRSKEERLLHTIAVLASSHRSTRQVEKYPGGARPEFSEDPHTSYEGGWARVMLVSLY